MCRAVGICFNLGSYIAVLQEIDNGKTTNVWQIYMTKLNSLGGKNGAGDDFDSSDSIDVKEEKLNAIKNEGLNIDDEILSRWGNLPISDLEFLEYNYNQWVTRHQCETRAEEILYEEICQMQLDIKKTRETGGDVMKKVEALQKLMAGNKNYVSNKLTSSSKCNAYARKALANSQKPYAIILSCSDSRVPPEIIFDKGLGEIFVIRVAGNVPDPVVLGSIEYAAEHLGTPLIMVLGHERCGAVKATIEAKGKSTGSKNIDAIVKKIAASTKIAAKDCAACKANPKCIQNKPAEFAECLADANAKSIAANLPSQSAIIKHLVHEKKIKIVAAKYDLDDGIVTLLK
jgi:carbonic anhydrase